MRDENHGEKWLLTASESYGRSSEIRISILVGNQPSNQIKFFEISSRSKLLSFNSFVSH